jgi:hypothetical protein
MFAARHDSLVYQLRQLSADRRARANIQQKKLFNRHGTPALLLVADLDDDVEIDNGFEEG